MTTYVDLLAAPDYLVVDTASFDDNFWATNQQQMRIDAAKYGKELSPRTAAPSYTVTNITDMAQFDNWVRLSDTSAPPVTAPSGGGVGAGAVLGGLALLGVGVWWLSKAS